MSASSENHSVHDAREAVAMAYRLEGRKRGAWLAARLLGVSERMVKAITYGEQASVDPSRAQAARNILARQRAAAIRAELETLEGGTNEGTILDARQQVLGGVR